MANLIHDTRVYRGPDINSDHFLLVSKVAIPARWKRFKCKKKEYAETFKVHLLQQESIRKLYQRRIEQYMTQTSISRNINQEWYEIKQIIIQAANESLGTRKKNYKQRGLKIWNDELAKLISEKKKEYLNYLNKKTTESLIEYKRKCAIVRREVRKIKRTTWEKYVSDIEHDVHGKQVKAYKIMKYLNNDNRENLKLNPISEIKWMKYYQNLWTEKSQEDKDEMKIETDEHIDPITFEEYNIAISHCQNKKAPGIDGINGELIKYAPISLKIRLLDFLNICWKFGHIPEE